jgi:hypothetical protein
MPAHDRPFTVVERIPLAVIDAAVCARLGPARVAGNAQPAAFNRQVAMYLAKHVGGWSTTTIGNSTTVVTIQPCAIPFGGSSRCGMTTQSWMLYSPPCAVNSATRRRKFRKGLIRLAVCRKSGMTTSSSTASLIG